jgi:mycothiol synthase
VESLTNWYTHLVNTDPAEDILLAEVAGALAGYQYTSWRPEATGAYIYTLGGYVDPAWRRRGLGAALLARGEARLRAVAAGQRGNSPRYFQTFTAETRVGKVALFTRHGYHVERHFYDMQRPLAGALPPVTLPAGLELRPVDPRDRATLRAIWEASEEAFRDHWGNSAVGEADFARLLDDPDTDPTLWQVAWDPAAGQVAGVSINAIHAANNAALGHARGWVDDLSVRRPYWRRGLGRALLTASLHALRARGCTQAALGVDTQNPTGALGLYENVGFTPFQHSLALRKALQLDEGA